jgi:hypothetical protein
MGIYCITGWKLDPPNGILADWRKPEGASRETQMVPLASGVQSGRNTLGEIFVIYIFSGDIATRVILCSAKHAMCCFLVCRFVDEQWININRRIIKTSRAERPLPITALQLSNTLFEDEGFKTSPSHFRRPQDFWRQESTSIKLYVYAITDPSLTNTYFKSVQFLFHWCWLTYWLTPCSRVLLEKLTGLQLVKKFPTFYETRMFITAFTSAHHLSHVISAVPVTTAWRVLRLRMGERPPIWRVAANILNK